MNCLKTMDLIYEYSGNKHDPQDSMPLFDQIQVWIHTFFCENCAGEVKRLEEARNILRRELFYLSPDLEDSIMMKIAAEEDMEITAVPGGLSTRGWVITGLIILVSLGTAFFGFDFKKIANETGISFLLPAGITIGIILTTYCVFFIGSHLKELSERFGL